MSGPAERAHCAKEREREREREKEREKEREREREREKSAFKTARGFEVRSSICPFSCALIAKVIALSVGKFVEGNVNGSAETFEDRNCSRLRSFGACWSRAAVAWQGISLHLEHVSSFLHTYNALQACFRSMCFSAFGVRLEPSTHLQCFEYVFPNEVLPRRVVRTSPPASGQYPPGEWSCPAKRCFSFLMVSEHGFWRLILEQCFFKCHCWLR